MPGTTAPALGLDTAPAAGLGLSAAGAVCFFCSSFFVSSVFLTTGPPSRNPFLIVFGVKRPVNISVVNKMTVVDGPTGDWDVGVGDE